MRQTKGFTLVELLVSISIIATLTAIIVPNFMGARERARDAQKIQDMQAFKNAMRMYYNDHQSYPSTMDTSEIAAVTTYLPSFGSLITEWRTVENGWSYNGMINNGDSFRLSLNLEAGSGDEDEKSQRDCGITETVDKVYMVCAN